MPMPGKSMSWASGRCFLTPEARCASRIDVTCPPVVPSRRTFLVALVAFAGGFLATFFGVLEAFGVGCWSSSLLSKRSSTYRGLLPLGLACLFDAFTSCKRFTFPLGTLSDLTFGSPMGTSLPSESSPRRSSTSSLSSESSPIRKRMSLFNPVFAPLSGGRFA